MGRWLLILLCLLSWPGQALVTSECDEQVETQFREDRGEALRLWNRGREFLRQGQAEIAIERLQQALATPYFRAACWIPGHPGRQQVFLVTEDLALAHLATGDYQRSLNTLVGLFLLKSKPSQRSLQIKLRADFHLMREQEMQRSLRQLLHYYKKHQPELAMRWQSLLDELTLHQNEEQWLERLEELDSDPMLEPMELKAYSHWQLGMLAMASYYWQQELRREPEHPAQHWLAMYQYRELLE